MSITTADQVQYLDVKPADIAVHPDNPRHDPGPIDDLVASAKDRGILEPLLVAMPYDGMTGSIGKATYVLIAGHRRLAAAKKARLATVPVKVHRDWTTRGDQISAMLIENLHRRDLTPVEEGEGYQLLMDVEGLTQAKTAARIQQSPKRVRDRLKIVKLPKGVLGRIHDGQITLEEALEAAVFTGDEAVMKKLEKAAGTNNFAIELEQAKRQRQAEQDWRSLVKQIRDAGYAELDQFDLGGARVVSELPHLWYQTWNRNEAWAAEKRVHGDCPHRAVVIVEHGAQVAQNVVRFYCTKPEVHNPDGARGVEDTPLPESDEERAAREAEEAERTAREQARLELQAKLEAAAAVRRDYVANVLHHKTGDEGIAKRLLLAHHRAGWAEGNISGSTAGHLWPVVAAWLRLDVELALHENRADALDTKLDKLTLPALAMLTRLDFFIQSELALTNSGNVWPTDDADDVEWFRVLTDEFAYPWSDFEREHFGLDAEGHVPAPADADEGDA